VVLPSSIRAIMLKQKLLWLCKSHWRNARVLSLYPSCLDSNVKRSHRTCFFCSGILIYYGTRPLTVLNMIYCHYGTQHDR